MADPHMMAFIDVIFRLKSGFAKPQGFLICFKDLTEGNEAS